MGTLTTIYSDLAGITVTAQNRTPGVRELDEDRNRINAADLPLRLQLLSSSQRAEGSSFTFMTIGQQVANISWRLVELMLWQPQNEGQGLHDADPDLAAYMDAYTTALLGFGGSGTTPYKEYRLTNATFNPGIYRWPLGANSRAYFGVLCELEVLEIDP